MAEKKVKNTTEIRGRQPFYYSDVLRARGLLESREQMYIKRTTCFLGLHLQLAKSFFLRGKNLFFCTLDGRNKPQAKILKSPFLRTNTYTVSLKKNLNRIPQHGNQIRQHRNLISVQTQHDERSFPVDAHEIKYAFSLSFQIEAKCGSTTPRR